MQSTPYYVPLHPNYRFNGSENASKPSSSVIVPGFDAQADPVLGFLADKIRIVEASIRQVVEELDERQKLQESTIAAIDKESCVFKERLFQVAPHGSSPFTVGDSRRRASIESEIAALEKEKRHEKTAAFKDVASLKKELRELIREYLEEKRKERAMRP